MEIADIIKLDPRIGKIIYTEPHGNPHTEYVRRKRELTKMVGWFAEPGTPPELTETDAFDAVMYELERFVGFPGTVSDPRRRRMSAADRYDEMRALLEG